MNDSVIVRKKNNQDKEAAAIAKKGRVRSDSQTTTVAPPAISATKPNYKVKQAKKFHNEYFDHM